MPLPPYNTAPRAGAIARASAARLAHAARAARAALVVAALALLAQPGGAQAGGKRQGPMPIANTFALEGAPTSVMIAGRATVASGLLQRQSLDIAVDDGSAAIRVYGRTMTTTVREGDSVVATGVIRRYRGALELDATAVTVVPAPPRIVPPRVLRVPRVEAEDEGRLVRTRGFAGASGTSEGGLWLVLHGRGASRGRDSLTVWVAAAHAGPPPLKRVREGDALVVTGIVSAFQDNPGDPRVWQLLPRDGDDVRVIGFPRRLLEQARLLLFGLVVAALLLAAGARLVARRHRRALAEAEDRYQQLLALSPDAVLVHADGAILFANPAAARLLGVAGPEALVAQPIERFWPAKDEPVTPVSVPVVTGQSPRWVKDAARELAARDAAEGGAVRTRLLTVDGVAVDVEATASPCRFHDRAATMVLARDVRVQLRHERELRALAQLDELTGVFNRRGFQLHADTMRREHAAEGRPIALAVADLDGLKLLNDSRGHAAGDAAIRAVAARLRDALGDGALVARWGGDEFVALVVMPSDDAGAMSSLSERLQAALDRVAVTAGGASFTTAASVGVAPLPPGGASSTADALAEADARLYARKRARREPLVER